MIEDLTDSDNKHKPAVTSIYGFHNIYTFDICIQFVYAKKTIGKIKSYEKPYSCGLFYNINKKFTIIP